MKSLILFFLVLSFVLSDSSEKYDGYEPSLLASDPPSGTFDGFPRFMQTGESLSLEKKTDNYDQLLHKLEHQAENMVKESSSAFEMAAEVQENSQRVKSLLEKAKRLCGAGLEDCQIGAKAKKGKKQSVAEFWAF